MNVEFLSFRMIWFEKFMMITEMWCEKKKGNKSVVQWKSVAFIVFLDSTDFHCKDKKTSEI